MKLMLIARSFPPVTGGIETLMYNIYSRYPNDDLVVVAPIERNCNSFDEKQNFRIYRTSPVLKFLNKNKLPVFPLIATTLRTLANNNIEQIHCDQVQSGIIGYLFKKIIGIPYIVWVYGGEIAGGSLSWLKFIVLKNADIIIVISNYTKRILFRMGIKREKIVTIYPGVNTGKFAPNIDCKLVMEKHGLQGKCVVLSVGRLSSKEQHKGFDFVIKSFSEVLSKIPNAIYLIVGDGDDEKRLKRLRDLLGLEKKVVFAGYASDDLLPQYYSAADVFVMPSRKVHRDGHIIVEGFGIVFLEANSCCKPVIGGRSGGIEDAVIDGVTGILIDPNNIDEIAEKIIELLSDNDLAQRLGRQGRNRAVNELSWEKVASKVRDVVNIL